MRVFLLEMDLLLPYEYTSHCTEPLSNRVGQDHHWISFCPWAITVPSVDRLSKMRWLHSSLPRYRDVHPTVSTLVLSQSESISVRTYLTSSLDDLITSWLQQTSYSFFLFSDVSLTSATVFPVQMRQTEQRLRSRFLSTALPLQGSPTNDQRAPRDNQPPTPKFHFLRRRAEAPHVVLYGGFRLTSRRHPKNLLLFWRRCVLPHDLNIPLKIASG